MNLDRCSLDPVAVVLTEIEVGGAMRFSGTDLDSGGQMVITIECTSHAQSSDPRSIYEAKGLILVLTIQKLEI